MMVEILLSGQNRELKLALLMLMRFMLAIWIVMGIMMFLEHLQG